MAVALMDENLRMPGRKRPTKRPRVPTMDGGMDSPITQRDEAPSQMAMEAVGLRSPVSVSKGGAGYRPQFLGNGGGQSTRVGGPYR